MNVYIFCTVGGGRVSFHYTRLDGTRVTDEPRWLLRGANVCTLWVRSPTIFDI